MTQPHIQSIAQKILVDNIGSIALTPVTQDASGQYVRELRIFGVSDASNPQIPLVFTLRLSSPTQSSVAITTPTLSF